mmetsp:Transcript_58373/g.110065  ORF Transcript_58373/g.110065 Transcript_58373/m.110065 type:complete len:221 (+) Transcript_58373:170-832(+)
MGCGLPILGFLRLSTFPREKKPFSCARAAQPMPAPGERPRSLVAVRKAMAASTECTPHPKSTPRRNRVKPKAAVPALRSQPSEAPTQLLAWPLPVPADEASSAPHTHARRATHATVKTRAGASHNKCFLSEGAPHPGGRRYASNAPLAMHSEAALAAASARAVCSDDDEEEVGVLSINSFAPPPLPTAAEAAAPPASKAASVNAWGVLSPNATLVASASW